MKLTLEPTSFFVELNGARCRVWQGDTDRGTPVHAHIALVGVDRERDAPELDEGLRNVATPRAELELYDTPRPIALTLVPENPSAQETTIPTAVYMNLRCRCGKLRRDHAHGFRQLPGGRVDLDPAHVSVIMVDGSCDGFVWRLETEMTGDPRTNKHLGPLMAEGD